MKSPTQLVLRAGSTLALCLVSHPNVLADTGAAAQSANAPAASPQKPYVLFIGADVAVEKDKVFRPIDEVTPSVIVARADGKQVNVPLGRGVNLQMGTGPKISVSGAGISDLKAERAYSPAADPFRTIEGYNSAVSGANDVADLARGALLKDQGKLGATAAGPASPAQQQAQQVLAADQAAVDQATEQADHESVMLPVAEAKAGTEESGGTYDAIRVSFAVTPEHAMAKAYVAVIAQVQDPTNPSGKAQPWIHLQSLGSVAAGETRKVNVYEEGLPSGYGLGTCEVHLYDGRSELATNLSAKRVNLTKDEMLDFRVIQYVAANGGRTAPAAPAMFANDLRPSLSPAELNQACYVRVAKDGRVAATFVDKEATQPLRDQMLDAALKGLRFKPAIDAGKPVESIVAIRLGSLAPARG
jgi:hypothetical protein